MPPASLTDSRRYWLPFAAFATFTAVEGMLPASMYPWAYTAKILVTLVVLFMDRRVFRAIVPSWSVVGIAALVGTVVFVQWVWLERVIPYPSLGSRIGFDPTVAIPDPSGRTVFLVVRMFGLIALVPVIEELFWRGFAIRYFTNEDFERVPMGTFSASAFWSVTIGSAVTHPEWLVALIAFALYAWLLRHTRSLFAVILAHAVTNAALGAYILTTREWRFW